MEKERKRERERERENQRDLQRVGIHFVRKRCSSINGEGNTLTFLLLQVFFGR